MNNEEKKELCSSCFFLLEAAREIEINHPDAALVKCKKCLGWFIWDEERDSESTAVHSKGN